MLMLASVTLLSCRDAGDGASARGTSAPPPVISATPYLKQAQPRLPTMKLYVGSEELTAELATRPVEIFTGMMWRTNMPEGDAMLFVFSSAEPRAFYMRNTFVPLSVAYINPEGVIEEIHDLHPSDENPVPSRSENIQFVLEVPQGWFRRHNITPGMLVRTAQGELRKSFSLRRP